jgi:hypothetical protein
LVERFLEPFKKKNKRKFDRKLSGFCEEKRKEKKLQVVSKRKKSKKPFA